MPRIKQYITLWLTLVVWISAQSINPLFKRITVSSGLSQNTVNSIIQDKYGFMWFGTQDGLNRFDGYEFKVYRNKSGSKTSLSNNFIWKIYEDSSGIIWIGTFGGGLNKFDPTKEIFTHYKAEKGNDSPLTNDNVFEIFEYPSGVLWLGTNNGLNMLDVKSGEIKQYEKLTNHSGEGEPTNLIDNIAITEPGKVWFNSNKGLSLLETVSGEVSYFEKDPFGSEIEIGEIDDISAVNNNLYVLCAAGLVELNFSIHSAKVILSSKQIEEFTGPGFSFSEVYVDNDNLIWIGTDKGLFNHNRATGKLEYFQSEDINPNSLTHNSILTFCKSTGSVYWIGTQSGLTVVERLRNEFHLIKRNSGEKNQLIGDGVGPVIEDKFGYTWVWNRSSEALNVFDRKTERSKALKSEPGNPNSLSANYILSLHEDSKSNIWVGTRGGGLNRIFNKGRWNDKFTIDRINPVAEAGENFNIERVQIILEDQAGLIWLGTGGGGLCSYNPSTNKIKSYPYSLDGSGPSHTFVYSLFEDSYGNFWVGTATGGLNLMNRQSREFLYFINDPSNSASLSNNLVLNIYESKAGDIWIGTAGGLNKLITENKENLFDDLSSGGKLEFKNFGSADGFPNEVIYGILEDGEGFFWMSTNKGILKFDPENEKVISTYDITDGLQNNEFNQNSFFKNKEGLMYFGGVAGLNIFDPGKIAGNTSIPPIVITDFKLFNETVPVNSNSVEDKFTLEKNIYALNKLNLSYAHKVFSFEFSALNYISTGKNEYAYKMEGFDKDWIYTGSTRTVTYTNLDPGEYTFRVRGSNNKGVWNEEGSAIAISIAPPPWLSWYAYLIYMAIFISGVLLFIRYRVKEATRELEVQNKIERAKLEEREEVRKKSSADFHDEAGNKLTKIALFTELARNEVKDNPELLDFLNNIDENTKELSSGMRDFIWVLDTAKESLYDTISRLKDFGINLFRYTDSRFIVKGLSDDMKKNILTMESRRAMILIFKEAMNNCVKYADALNIELIADLAGDDFRMILKDDGSGFVPEKESDGYGLKNMRNRATKIGANISIDSSPGNGTIITFKSKITHMGD